MFGLRLSVSSSASSAQMLLLCHGDSVMMIMCELIKGALALEERRRQHGVWEKVSKSMDVMIEFARDIQTFMVASLPEMEELMQEYDENEKLSVALVTLFQSVKKNFESVTEECAELWELLEDNFPVDKEEFGGRFSCKENSIMESIRKLKKRSDGECFEIEHDLTSNYSELVLMDLIELSFLLILASSRRVSGHQWGLRKEMALNKKLNKFMATLKNCRLQHERDVEHCEKYFQQYFEQLEASASDGSPLTLENRFSIEYKLYQNSESISKVVQQISETLSSIQTQSLSMLPVMKSHEDIESALFSAHQSRAEAFQKLQITLEAKVNALNKFWKLENQLLRKIIQRSFPKTSSKIDLEEDNDKQNETQQTDLQSDFDELNNASGMNAGNWSYENDDSTEDDENHDPVLTSSEVLDEYYELVMGKDDPEDEKNVKKGPDEDEEEVQHEARQIVLEQLKTVLKPRHEAMKTREEEAYRRVYGEKKPETESDTEDEEGKVLLKVKQRKRIKAELVWGDEDAYKDDEEEEEREQNLQKHEQNVFGSDDDDDNDEIISGGDGPMISADFRSKLDIILKTGGGFPPRRLSSSSEND